MEVTVRLFALARERVGQSEARVEVPEPATVAGLRAALRARWPELGPLWDRAMIAIAEERADDAAPIAPDVPVAVIPPVSGGAPAPARGEAKAGRGAQQRKAQRDD